MVFYAIFLKVSSCVRPYHRCDQGRKETWLLQFFVLTFKEFQIAIWFGMLLEDIQELLPLIMPRQFICKFVFVWVKERCSQMLGRITPTLIYYLKDLNITYLEFYSMFHHHIEDHVLLINDKPNKAICNSHYNCVFLESFKGQHLTKSNIQVMDLCLCLWLILKHLPHALMMKNHHPYMCILFCPPFCHFEPSYSWFMQFKSEQQWRSFICVYLVW